MRAFLSFLSLRFTLDEQRHACVHSGLSIGAAREAATMLDRIVFNRSRLGFFPCNNIIMLLADLVLILFVNTSGVYLISGSIQDLSHDF